MKRSTIITIVFWIFFLGSFGLYGHYPVVDTIWVVVGRLFILALGVVVLAQIFRDRGKVGNFSYGFPRWLQRILMDEEEPHRNRKTDRSAH